MAQENGKLLAWRKKEGESVSKGEPLLEIETDKRWWKWKLRRWDSGGNYGGCGSGDSCWETIAWLVAPGEKPPRKWLRLRCGEGDERGASCCCGAGAGATIDCGRRGCADFAKARRLAKELGVTLRRFRARGLMADYVGGLQARKREARCCSGAAVGTIAAHEPLSQFARLMAERTRRAGRACRTFPGAERGCGRAD